MPTEHPTEDLLIEARVLAEELDRDRSIIDAHWQRVDDTLSTARRHRGVQLQRRVIALGSTGALVPLVLALLLAGLGHDEGGVLPRIFEPDVSGSGGDLLTVGIATILLVSVMLRVFRLGEEAGRNEHDEDRRGLHGWRD